MSESNEQTENVSLVPWDPVRYLRAVDPHEAHLSRGFLRSRPEKWFPGLGTQWLPLAHSLGVELKMVEVKPVLRVPGGLEVGFVATIDNEPISIFFDHESNRVILDAVAPGAGDEAKSVVSEYLVRRLVSGLGKSWSGPESSVVRFESEMSPDDVRAAGAVMLNLSVNGVQCNLWISMGQLLVERLDTLWRKQVHSTSRGNDSSTEVSLEVAQLAVPPSMLSDYMKSGTVIDLEVPVSDTVTLEVGTAPWLPAQMCIVDGKLAFQTINIPVSAGALPEGTTRLSIEFGSVLFDSAAVSEMSQIGSIWVTDIDVETAVSMVINGERVGSAMLCTYEGRFAVSVS